MRLSLVVTSLIFFISVAHAAKEPSVGLISGFDDVLRQAENQNLFKAALKLFEKDRTFAGMPELYRELGQPFSKNPSLPAFMLISGTSSFFKGRIDSFLLESRYPKAEVHLRNWLTQWSVEDFKIERIQELLRKNEDHNFIVIFDNSGPSIEMARTLPQKFPGRILKVYLREVVHAGERPKTGGEAEDAFLFITAFDIALNELQSGRIDSHSVKNVAQAILSETDSQVLIPSYAYCPVDYDPCAAHMSIKDSVSGVCVEVRERILGLCRARSAGR